MMETERRKYPLQTPDGRIEIGEGEVVRQAPGNEEPWVDHALVDGTVVRVKVVLVEAVRMIDRYDADGTPSYLVKFHTVHHISAPQSLRRPVQ